MICLEVNVFHFCEIKFCFILMLLCVTQCTLLRYTCPISKVNLYYCRFGNVRENLIFAYIGEFAALRIQSSR